MIKLWVKLKIWYQIFFKNGFSEWEINFYNQINHAKIKLTKLNDEISNKNHWLLFNLSFNCKESQILSMEAWNGILENKDPCKNHYILKYYPSDFPAIFIIWPWRFFQWWSQTLFCRFSHHDLSQNDSWRVWHLCVQLFGFSWVFQKSPAAFVQLLLVTSSYCCSYRISEILRRQLWRFGLEKDSLSWEW